MNLLKTLGGLLTLMLCSTTATAQEIEEETIMLETIEVFDKDLNDTIPDRPVTKATGQPEEILAAKAGFDLIYRGAYAPEINYQGMAASRLAVTINGMRIFSACTDRMDPVTSYVDAINLDEAQLSQSGGGAGHSHLNLTLNGPKSPPGWSGTIESFAHEARRTLGTSVKVNHRNKNGYFSISSAYRKAWNYLGPNRKEILNTGFNKVNVALSGGYRLSQDHSLDLDVIIDDAWDIGYAGLPMDVAYARGRIFGLSHKWRLNRDLVQTKIYLNTIDHAMDDRNRPDAAMHMDMPGWSRTQGAWIQWMRFGDNWKWDGKLEFFSNRQRAEMTMYPEDEIPMYMLTWPDVRRTTSLAHFGISKTIRSLTVKAEATSSVVISTILDQQGIAQMSVFGYDISEDRLHTTYGFSLTGDLNVNPVSTISVSASIGQRAPITSELYGFYLYNAADGFDYLGDPDLRTEKDLSLQFSGKTRILGWTTTLTLGTHFLRDYIYGEYRQEIDPMTIGAKGIRQYVNLASAHLLSADLRISRQWGVFGTATGISYTYGDKGRMDDPLPLIAPARGWVMLSYDTNWGKFSLSQKYSLPQDRVDPELSERLSPGWTTTDLNWDRKWDCAGHTLSTGLGIQNIFDTSYTDHLDWGRVIRPGRNLYVRLAWDLWKNKS